MVKALDDSTFILTCHEKLSEKFEEIRKNLGIQTLAMFTNFTLHQLLYMYLIYFWLEWCHFS